MRKGLVLAAALAASLGLSACHRPVHAPPSQVSQAKAFLAKNATAPGVHVLPDGLQYKVVQSGPASGGHPEVGDEVKVNYEGKLLDGTVFDSSYQRGTPEVMPVKGLIKGWQEALQLMRPGDEWILYVPPELAYGDQGAGGAIPPGAALIFRIELIDFLPGPERVLKG